MPKGRPAVARQHYVGKSVINFVFLPDSHRSLKTLHPRSRILYEGILR